MNLTPKQEAVVKPLLADAITKLDALWTAECELEKALGIEIDGLYDFMAGRCDGPITPEEAPIEDFKELIADINPDEGT